MQKKFGTFRGVFIPSYEAIFGTVLFLVLPMLTGAVGFWRMAFIVLLSNTVTIATAFSLSDCVTNLRHVGSGGMYALARRSFGRAFGGSIGIQLFLAQSVSIGFYVIGFAEPLQGLLSNLPGYEGLAASLGLSVLRQKQVLASILAVVGFISALIGADFTSRIQMVIFFVLTASVGSILLSPLFGASTGEGGLFTYTPNLEGVPGMFGFWVAFAAFFPAVTGIDAGVGMSGELKDARRSLPMGTFLAIGVTLLGYLGVTYVYSLMDPNLLLPGERGEVPSLVSLFGRNLPAVSFLVLLGILFATGSSALAYFLTAPRTLKTLAEDGILPGFLSFVRKDFVKGGTEPRWASVLTFLIVLGTVWSGDITFVSTVVGICFLVVYGWINVAAFFERMSGNPSFRPTFRGHWAISLYGALLSLAVIGLFNVWVGLGVLASQLLLFWLLLKYRAGGRLEGVWWGLIFSVLQWAFGRMRRIIQGTKNWRPVMGVFAFADRPEQIEQGVRVASMITAFKGLSVFNLLGPDDFEGEIDSGGDTAVIFQRKDPFSALIRGAALAAVPGGLVLNTVLLPLDRRLNLIELVEELAGEGRHVLLYKHGVPRGEEDERIDVWWKGQENGNLMALLAYIIRETDAERGLPRKRIRLIRVLGERMERVREEAELRALLQAARLEGEVLLLDPDERPFDEVVEEHSRDASLVLMGMPGQRASGLARVFSLDRREFDRQIARFDELPPVLFVKSAYRVALFDEE
ncbi:amino acid permease [Spirochaeta thermophila]|uniref:Solute carrier family 12 member 7 n=1 Tax=Winmispira thermophila (strain ATCC 49972 / DSM 6192 / RI 19.B1) TaxID=665571 RepID=E0RQA7_WINT6|nr:amino acid permease [Spirochaeta thermophila]ADN02883.1 solute carrier family 12 member 7 [Spirochaeta thermophila DSM 6192]